MSLSTPNGQLSTNTIRSIRPSKSCPICLNETDGDLSCFKCNKWYHASCVNVESPLPNTWLCTACVTFHDHGSLRSNKSISSKVSNTSKSKSITLKLKMLEEERQLSIARDKEFLNKKLQLLQQVECIEDDIESNSSVSVREWLTTQTEISASENVTPLTAPLDTSAGGIALNLPLSTTVNPNCTNNYITKNKNSNPRASCLPQLIYSSPRIATSEYISCNHNSVQVYNPIYTATTALNDPLCRTTQASFIHNSSTAAPVFNQSEPHQTVRNNYSSHRETNYTTPDSHNINIFPNNFRSSFVSRNNLSVGQIQARASVPKELPIFSGKPEDWPLFNSTFEWSTEVCGLSDSENLIRLQRSLKGDALKAVQNILIHPACVGTAISTLKFLFGQPEHILNSMRNNIRSAPPVNANKLETISNFAVQVKGFLATFEACGLYEEMNNTSLLQELVDKLPPNLQLEWGSRKLQLLKHNKKANLTEFSAWIFDIGLSASMTNFALKSNTYNNLNKPRNAHIHAHNTQEKTNCLICKKRCIDIAHCKKFLAADRSERWNFIRRFNICKKCLKVQNDNKICNCNFTCQINHCGYKHHSLLHKFTTTTVENRGENSNVKDTSENDNSNIESAFNCNAHKNKTDCVLFKIIPITMYGQNKIINTYAFIDEGSSISLVDEDLIEDLGLTGTKNPLCLQWTGHMKRREENSKQVLLSISGPNQKRFPIIVNTVQQLCLPSQTIPYKQLCMQFPHLKNLPINDYCNASPRLLIGANNWSLGIPRKIRESAPDSPVAVQTKLGWLIYGNIGSPSTQPYSLNIHTCECESNDVSINELVKQYFSLEGVGVKLLEKPIYGKEDERALNLLNCNTHQRSDNHYETGLLWRYDDVKLPESFTMAKKRLLCLERKLLADASLLAIFQKTISDYVQKGYMRKLNQSEVDCSKYKNRIWYLPIFDVHNKNKPNKVRIVWDAAAMSHGISLNSMLLKGPDLLSSLTAILFRFRQKSVAICGDIQEMFHQIFIKECDQHCQRFLWRDCDKNRELNVYVMNVMIFGAACAPSISQYIKNYNAEKFKVQYPAAVQSIQFDHYVDDLLTSVDTENDAIQLAEQVKYIHAQGGFHIRNWCSNSLNVLNALNETAENLEKNLSIADNKTEKVLGVFWVASKDNLIFKIAESSWQSDIFNGKQIPTKRQVLRVVMTIYDPLGLIGNFIMYAKILLQHIWRSKIDWDEPIKPDEYNKWKKWISQIPEIRKLSIPRCYLKIYKDYNNLQVHLHTFVDASLDGYAAVSYFRISDGTNISCSLIGSKTRVAPLKITSIPRLELMSALIGARYSKTIINSHTIKITKKYFWTDSRNVLGWLRSDHRRYSQFVAFRVSEILDNTELDEWNWVPSKLNAADEATKWAKLPNFTHQSRWFYGPEFLRLHENEWPKENETSYTTSEELKAQIFFHTNTEPVFDVSRFSKWNRLLRTAAYVERFKTLMCKKNMVSNKSFKPITITPTLTSKELQAGENILYQQAQKEFYAFEIQLLRSHKFLPKSSDLYKLSAYLDAENILRIDGRIELADVFDENKKPIILPRKSAITKLIIHHYHCKLHHMNHETVINELRQRFYISRLRTALKAIIRDCQTCKIQKAMPVYPRMAKLPKARLAAFTHPFSFTGLDFFGPINIVVNRHTEKRYGALFTCLTVRAVHIEVVHSLTTSSCIMAIRNFICKRGTPIEFFSDNGTNFIGAERELREAIADVNQDEFVREFTTATSTWNFNPPTASHMGGVWERLVRSIKTVLYKIMPTQLPSEELLRSMMAEVENIVNSRPLTYVPLDEENSEVLTPNHFLLGCSNGMKPLAIYDDNPTRLRQNWLRSQQYAERFWRQWVSDYLPTLTCRKKWHDLARPLRVGDLVVVVDYKLPRNVWPKGKVIEVKLATDGQTRSAKILTSHGILERPTTKLAVLDVARDEE